MEKSKSKSRVSEIVIVVLMLVCAVLVIGDMTSNLIDELETRESQVVLEEEIVNTPTPAVRPTLPPDFTPEPILDA